MKTLEVEEEQPLIIPAGIVDLDSFRRWTRSEAFPKRGKISYFKGRIEVDMTAAKVQRHSGLKTDLSGDLRSFVRARNLGQSFVDQTRLVLPFAETGYGPDIVYVSWPTLQSGTVRFELAANPMDDGDQIEVVGPPDIVIEVMSTSSVRKDTHDIPEALFLSGAPEYWLADGRLIEPTLTLHRRGPNGFVPVAVDEHGFQRSDVLNASFRLAWDPGLVSGTFLYRLENRID